MRIQGMTFKTWLEGLEEYEPFRSKVEELRGGRDFAFRNWWPAGQDRIVLPFEKKDETSEAQKDIEELLADFKGLPTKGLPAALKYILTDYKAGLAQPEGKKNQYKIMRILNAMEETQLKKIDDELASSEISPSKATQERNSWKKFYTGIKDEFMNDPIRSAKGSGLKVVISRDIHDIASMSTGRGWTSCMHLRTGLHKNDPYCEVRNGGFVAYLVKEGDEDVKSPIARLHIRRFQNPKGESIAVPEEQVYGADTPYLIEFMKDWIASKQGRFKAGIYRRKGGKYSDTFEKTKNVLVPPETDPKYYEKYFKKWINLGIDQRGQGPRREIIKKMISNVVKFSDPTKIDADILKRLGEILFPDVYGDEDRAAYWAFPHLDFGVCRFMKYFPQSVTKKVVDRLIDEVKQKKMTPRTSSFQSECSIILLKNFGHLLDEEQKKYLKPDWSSLLGRHHDPELVQQRARQAAEDLGTDLSLENLLQHPFLADENMVPTIRNWHPLTRFISDTLATASLERPMRPQTATAIYNFYKQVLPKIRDIMQARSEKFKDKMDNVDKYEAEKFAMAIEKDIGRAFSHSNADLPQVIRFYQEIMPRLKDHGGFLDAYGVGMQLANIGNNATPFLPLLRNLIKVYDDLKHDLKNNPEFKSYRVSEADIDGNIEKINYIIDSIEKGRLSTKYSNSPQNFSFWAEDYALPKALKLSGYA
jgi:hypothetical protein